MPGNPGQMTSLVNTRGRVIWVRDWEVDMLRAQGAKIIRNPKEDYYAEFDVEGKNSSNNRDAMIETLNSDENNLLECEAV